MQAFKTGVQGDLAAIRIDIAEIKSDLRWIKLLIGIGYAGGLLRLLLALSECSP